MYELARVIDSRVKGLSTEHPSLREKYNPTVNIRFLAKKSIVFGFMAFVLFLYLIFRLQ